MSSMVMSSMRLFSNRSTNQSNCAYDSASQDKNYLLTFVSFSSLFIYVLLRAKLISERLKSNYRYISNDSTL